jgi:hypothetical protein
MVGLWSSCAVEEKGLAQLLAGTLGQDPSGQRRPPRRNPSEPGLPNARERPQGGLKTGKHMLGAPMVGLALLARENWAIVGADIGGNWVQASWKDRIEPTNIISFNLGGNPRDVSELPGEAVRGSGQSQPDDHRGCQGVQDSVLSPKFVDDMPGLRSIPPTPCACTHPVGWVPGTARPCFGSSRLRRDSGPEPARGVPIRRMGLAQRLRDGTQALT